MPPKALTKAQLKRLEKERIEEERKKAEEMAEVKRLEDEEKLRLKLLKQEEKDAKFAEEEKIRLATEEVEVAGSLLKIRSATQAAQKDYEQYENWLKFISCEDKSDPNEEKDITRQLSKFEIEKVEEKLVVEPLLTACQEAESLNNELLIIRERAKIDDDLKKIEWCEDYIENFRKIIATKVDMITEHLANNTDVLLANKLKEIEEQKDNKAFKMTSTAAQSDKPEIFVVHAYNDIGYGNWINCHDKTGPRSKPNDFKELNILADVPRTMVSSKLIMRVWWTAYDYLSKKEYSKEHIIGGIVDVACYNFLWQPDKYKDLELKKIYVGSDALQKLNYPMPDSTGVINYQSITPVKIHFTLPKYTYIGPNDKIKVALWQEETQTWSIEHIEDVKLDYDKKTLTVSTLELVPFAFMQERNIDFPYKSWKIRKTSTSPTFQPRPDQPAKYDSIIIDIEGKRLPLRFEITAGKVFLRDRTEPELAHLVDKAMDPTILLYELRRSGINLLPCNEDAETCNIPLKNLGAEHKAAEDLAIAAKKFYVMSSKWNCHVNPNQILVRMRNNPECDEEFLEDQEKDWLSVAWWENKCEVVRVRESQDEPNKKRIKGSLTHTNFYMMLKDLQDIDEAKDLIPKGSMDDYFDVHNVLVYDTMTKFLKMTRVLSFTVG